VHIALCPDDVLHLTVGNVCLHLCRQDFLRLAQALSEAAAQMTAADATPKATKESLH